MASRPCPASATFIFILLSLALLSSSLQQAQGAGKEEEDYVPVRRVVYRRRPSSSALPTAEEAYEPFQLCDGCRCCAATNASVCVGTSCCYAIDCDIPGKPFGVCAFTPRTCGCGANNCTQQA